MSLFDDILRKFDDWRPPQTAHAHCDVPCGIYTPDSSHLAAETVVAMVTKIQALEEPAAGADKAARQAYANTLNRMIATKEEHAELCKREILILWTDYFTPAHAERFPDIHKLVWKATKLGSTNKREINPQAAQDLMNTVEQIGEIFRQSKT